jgi:hypothetical protein
MGKTLHLPREAHHFATARPAGNLYADQANNYYLDLFNLFPDFDEVMRRAGLSRTELRKLESDDEIGAATDTRREAVISTPWHLEGADGKPATGPDVDFLQEQLDPWIEQMARAAWAAVPFGYSVWETVYARLGGNSIGIARLWEKPFEWFAPRQEGGLLYRSLENPQGVEVDAVLKFFCTVREPTYRMPYGRALFSQLYWPWFFRKMGWQFWMKFLERWGTPILLGQTAGDKDKMAKALAKAVQNSVIAVGKDDDVEALGIGAGSATSRPSSALSPPGSRRPSSGRRSPRTPAARPGRAAPTPSARFTTRCARIAATRTCGSSPRRSSARSTRCGCSTASARSRPCSSSKTTPGCSLSAPSATTSC